MIEPLQLMATGSTVFRPRTIQLLTQARDSWVEDQQSRILCTCNFTQMQPYELDLKKKEWLRINSASDSACHLFTWKTYGQ